MAISKRTLIRQVKLRNEAYSRGLEEGIRRGREEARKECDEALKQHKAEAIIEVTKAAAGALTSIAGILDNAHGVLV